MFTKGNVGMEVGEGAENVVQNVSILQCKSLKEITPLNSLTNLKFAQPDSQTNGVEIDFKPKAEIEESMDITSEDVVLSGSHNNYVVSKSSSVELDGTMNDFQKPGKKKGKLKKPI